MSTHQDHHCDANYTTVDFTHVVQSTPLDQGEIDKHNQFMRLAIEQGNLALLEGEVPVGCVIVHNDNVIASGYNKTNIKRNTTRHAEIEAIDSIFLGDNVELKQIYNNEQLLSECVLYVTVEPCIMCAHILQISKIGKVYFGCVNDKFGGNGSILSLHNINCIENGRPYNCVSGLLKEEAIYLLQKFYFQENKNAPIPNKRKKVNPDEKNK